MGDHALSDLEVIRGRFVQVNGEHPMTEADDAYAREHFTPASTEVLAEIAAGRLPLPAYLLSDGTPMVADVSDCLGAAGGVDALHDWFVAFWPDDVVKAEREWETFLAGQHFALRKLNPLSIRNASLMIDQARSSSEALRADPQDEHAQGSLAEAINGGPAVMGLDQLLLPMTSYDRLRVGGPTVRDVWVDAPCAEFHDPRPPQLPIRTARLTLRCAIPEDAPASARAWADPDFVRYLLTDERNEAEATFSTYLRSQPFNDEPHRGLILTMEQEGANIGSVLLFFPGPDLSCLEIGWTLYPWAAGQGFATEGARAMLALAFEHYGVRRVVANLDALNLRSAALAERLGMRCESHRLADFWSRGRWTDSYDYAILRSEWQARQDP